jgi:acetoacetyl-CoA synthetase
VGVKLARWKDEQVFLFLVLKGAADWEALVGGLKEQIKRKLSPRHVPAHIHPAPAIPHTLNGKKVEISVKRILHGQFDLPVQNLANPASVDFFRQFARDLQGGKQQQKLEAANHNQNKL